MHVSHLISLILITLNALSGSCGTIGVRSSTVSHLGKGVPLVPTPSTSSGTELNKRVIIQDGLGFGFQAAWDVFQLILPAEQVGPGLERLYGDIVNLATQQLRTAAAAQHTFASNFGRFQFYMYCDRRVIPWQLIARFAQGMLAQTHAPSTYRMRIFHPQGQTVVRIEQVLPFYFHDRSVCWWLVCGI